MSAIEILFGSFIAGCVCSMKKMLKKLKKKFGGKEKRCTFAIPFGKRGSERPRRGQGERFGRTSRRDTGSSLKRLDRDSTREVPKTESVNSG